MRVYVEHDMTVCHVSNVVTLAAGAIVESPLADYLVESGCEVTIEQDDRPAPAPVETPPVETSAPAAEESHTPGGEHDGTEPADDAEADAEPGEAG